MKDIEESEKALESNPGAKERYEICKSCDEFTYALRVCSKCNCFMPVKTKMPWAKCPIGKWGV